MADVLEEFNSLQKAVAELDNIVLKKSDREIDFQLTEIKSSLADIKFLVSGDIYRKLFRYFDNVLPWMEVQSRYGKRNLMKSNTLFMTEFLSKMRTELLAKEERTLNNVFIAHGRDDKSKLELARMLENLGFNAIILSEQPDKGRTIIEKLEQEAFDIGYAFVILTPDDIGGVAEDWVKVGMTVMTKNAIEHSFEAKTMNCRARQNVILELGYFVGKIGRNRVCCLYKGNVELPSDIHGVLFKKFNDSIEECYKGILEELKAAGYEIRL